MTKIYDRFAAFYFNAQYTYNKKYNFYGQYVMMVPINLGLHRQQGGCLHGVLEVHGI